MKTLLRAVGMVCVLGAGGIAQVRWASIDAGANDTVSAAQQAALSRLQSSGANIAIAWNAVNATPAFLGGRLSSPGFENRFASPRDAAIAFVADSRALFRLVDPAGELTLLKTERDELGITHVRLQQTFQGLRIAGAQMIVHFGADGSVQTVNGRFSPTPQISTTPTVSAVQASAAASERTKAAAVSADLVVYLNDFRPVLAYEVKLPTPVAPRQMVTIDAQSGAVLDVDDGVRYDGPETGTGAGVSGTARTLNIYLSGGKYYLIDATKVMFAPPVDSLDGVVATWDAHNDTVDANPYKLASLVFDPNNDKTFNDNPALPAAVDAHHFTGKVYDYYRNHLARNSWDNAGGTLTNIVHYRSRYNNAFWNGSFMTYGDGDGVTFSNLAGSFDVIAHEITHGVTEATAALEYRGQSGALNESYSDVLACMADSVNWTIGEDVYTPSIAGDALRDLSNPHQGGSGLADPGWQPAAMSEYFYASYTEDHDLGGVHINSGIPNHAAYLVATSIGRAKTEQIYYRTLAHYLTPKSLFIDARLLSLQAAADLYGSGGPEYAAVAAGFDNVGIFSSLPRTDELAYDDGSPGTSVYETDASWGLVNRLTAPGSGKLMTVEFFYRGDNNTSGNGSFVIKIFADNNGQPGTNLFTSTTVTPNSGAVNTWFNGLISALNISVSGDFYIGIFYDGVNRPMIGADGAANGRAWEWDNAQGKWIVLDQNSYFPVTLFMRGIVSTATGVERVTSGTPPEFTLAQNYPNPFNPRTTIRFGLPQDSHVMLAVFNALGQQVAEPLNGDREAGYHEVSFDASNLPSGVYFCRLKARSTGSAGGVTGEFVQTRKLVLVR